MLGVALLLAGITFTLTFAVCDGFLCGAGLLWSVPLSFVGLVLALWPQDGVRSWGWTGVARRVGHPVALVVLAGAGVAHAVDGDDTFWRGMMMVLAASGAGFHLVTRTAPVPLRFTLGVLLAVAGGAASDAFYACGAEDCLVHLAWSLPAAVAGVALATWAMTGARERSVRHVTTRTAGVVAPAFLAVAGLRWTLDGGTLFFAGIAALSGACALLVVAVTRGSRG